MTTKLLPTENDEQRALVKWIRLHPEMRDLIIKMNNEGKRTEGQGWHLKMMGMNAGASDLLLALPKFGLSGLFLEVKRNKRYCKSEMETVSWINQLKFQANVRAVGYGCEFVFGWEHGKQVIQDYLAGKLNRV